MIGRHGAGRQPDNADPNVDEACLSLLHPGIYGDPSSEYKWHDEPCHIPQAVVCEDSDRLLSYIKTIYPDNAQGL